MTVISSPQDIFSGFPQKHWIFSVFSKILLHLTVNAYAVSKHSLKLYNLWKRLPDQNWLTQSKPYCCYFIMKSLVKSIKTGHKMGNIALGARFQKLGGGGVQFWERQGGAKFSVGTRFSRTTMFFCKHVFSVEALLLIIHITMYILKWY